MIETLYILNDAHELVFETHPGGTNLLASTYPATCAAACAATCAVVGRTLDGKKHFVRIKRAAHALVCILPFDTSPALAVEWMHRFVDLVCDYLGEFTERALHRNRVLLGRLADLMLDAGSPFLTEIPLLKHYVPAPKSFLAALLTPDLPAPAATAATATTAATAANPPPAKSEFCLHVSEETDFAARLALCGPFLFTVRSHHVSGAIKLNAAAVPHNTEATVLLDAPADPAPLVDEGRHACIASGGIAHRRFTIRAIPDGPHTLFRYVLAPSTPPNDLPLTVTAASALKIGPGALNICVVLSLQRALNHLEVALSTDSDQAWFFHPACFDSKRIPKADIELLKSRATAAHSPSARPGPAPGPAPGPGPAAASLRPGAALGPGVSLSLEFTLNIPPQHDAATPNPGLPVKIGFLRFQYTAAASSSSSLTHIAVQKASLSCTANVFKGVKYSSKSGKAFLDLFY